MFRPCLLALILLGCATPESEVAAPKAERVSGCLVAPVISEADYIQLYLEISPQVVIRAICPNHSDSRPLESAATLAETSGRCPRGELELEGHAPKKGWREFSTGLDFVCSRVTAPDPVTGRRVAIRTDYGTGLLDGMSWERAMREAARAGFRAVRP